ncbi:hypothetical protein GYMLUDRAFT_40247 [Collybiopsis luxurians FD-317 M1]|uniref:Uncharacterized protein n=1 Tax=Collybiopsis luxurians FD-317 M1 TaxID=944289 RepID=A0A0D0CW94_9AGAR|nr:hypothetical protein GYMLUDRAFT_40247 [Collybiopsis luxurians FD-317 M1]
MVAHAAEVQRLRKELDTLKEEGRTNTVRMTELVKDKENTETRLAEISRKHTTVSSEKDSLSTEVKRLTSQSQEAQTRIANFERQCREALASKDTLSTQLADRAREIETLKSAASRAAEEIKLARDDGSATAAGLRHKLDELAANTKRQLEANGTLRVQLQSTIHELEMERTRARAAALHTADEILQLTEARDNMRADFDRLERERDNLSNTSERTIRDLNASNRSLRIELETKVRELESERSKAASAKQCSSDEILSLTNVLDDTQAQCGELVVRVSDLEVIVQDKSKQLSSLTAEKDQMEQEFEVDRISMLAKIGELEEERDALKKKIGLLEQGREDGRASAFNRAKDLDRELQAVRRQKSELLVAKNREVETLKAEMQVRIDKLSNQISGADSSIEAKERDIMSLRSERDTLQRDLEASRTGQQLQRDMMSSDVRDLRARLAAANTNTRNERQAKEEFQNKLSQLETESATLRAQLAEAKEAVQANSAQLSAAVESRDRKINSLRNQRNTLKGELDRLRRQPDPSPAVPFPLPNRSSAQPQEQVQAQSQPLGGIRARVHHA